MKTVVRHGLLPVFLLALALALAGGLTGTTAWGAGDATEATCPNETLEGFQSFLPDCRAYEMVTPSYKDGYPAGVANAVSTDGSHVMIEMAGSFAGAVGGGSAADLDSNWFEFVRSGSGWVASALDPPGSVLPQATFLASSSDLGRTLWRARAASQSTFAEDLFVREPNGSFVEVGPMVPPSLTGGPPAGGFTFASPFYGDLLFAGASADLSHILFEDSRRSHGQPLDLPFWPGDTTSEESNTESSLYEYVGTGNTHPVLVGVNGTGRLISDCGTVLGADEGEISGARDDYNAVSSDGETVFFTAYSANRCTLPEGDVAPAVDELWARLSGIESAPISEPTAAQCRACDVGAVKAPAAFQGASQDGSKVFFLTGQELFAGDTGQNLYEYDFDSPPGNKIVRVSMGSAQPEVQGVARVSQDGSHVYFVAKGVLSGRNAEGREPVTGGENLYVFERDGTYTAGHVAFIATLSEADAQDWSLKDERPVQVTPDGRFLVFESVADLTSGDTSSEPQVFEYDAQQETLVRVSTGQVGYAGGLVSANEHGSSITVQSYPSISSLGFMPAEATTSLAVSAVGEGSQVVSRVVFASAAALTPSTEVLSGGAGLNLYEYRSVGSVANGDVYLISPGDGAREQTYHSAQSLQGLSESGGDVFFRTLAPLLVGDVDGSIDLYDARAGGGFPAPAVVGCEGEGCQGNPSAAPPAFGVAGSVSAPAGGSLPPVAVMPAALQPKPKPKPKHKHKHKPKRRVRRKHRRGVGRVLVRGKGSVVDVKGRG
jgi:hypothetical protein